MQRGWQIHICQPFSWVCIRLGWPGEGGCGRGRPGTGGAAPQRAGWRLRSRSSQGHTLWAWLGETGEIAVVCIVVCSFGIHNAAAADSVDKPWCRFFCADVADVPAQGLCAGAVSCAESPARVRLYVFTGLLRPFSSCVFAPILIRAPQLHQALRVQVLR